MSGTALSGQTALIPLPSLEPVRQHGHENGIKNNDDLNKILPVQLKIIQGVAIRNKGTDSGVIGNGMDVIKVAENGKRQPRRVAITSNGRVLLVSSEKVSMRGLFRKRSKLGESSESYKRIEISSIDRIVRGQMTKKFLQKTKVGVPLTNMPVEEERISLSIIFRINTASTHLIAVEEDLTITSDSSNSWASLDLIIPSHNNFELLIMTLNALMERNRIYRMNMSLDVLLLQHHWMEFGKNWGDHIHQAEWTTLICDRLSAPVKRSVIVSLYRKFCISLSKKPEEGITLPQAIDLLDSTRKLAFHMENKVDPCDVIWNMLLQYTLNYEETTMSKSDSDESTFMVDRDNKKKKKKVETVSVAAFLKFLRSQQKISNATSQQVKDLFECLNSVATAPQIMDDGITRKEKPEGKSYSRSHISKPVFFNYILSDANDAFDPIHGQWERDDMTQPLCSYWINSSHDTYLSEAPPKILDNNLFQTNFADCSVNVKMYATALYRGCRCLDLDVWDGKLTQKDEPVIKFDSEKYSSKARNSVTNGAPKSEAEPILFSDVVWLVRSFLLSNPTTLPVILCIENHSSLPNQNKMADHILTILTDEMVYIPKGNEEETLPSPNDLRGKVVIKFKIAGNTASAVFDDHDESNDTSPATKSKNNDDLVHKDEADLQVQGLDTVGSVISDSPHNQDKTPLELEKEAGEQLASAKAIAYKADQEAFDAKVKSNRAREFALQLMKKANMSVKDAELQLQKLERKVHRPSPARAARKVEESMEELSFDDDDTTYTNNDESIASSKGLLNQIFEWGKMNMMYGKSSSCETDNEDVSVFDESIMSAGQSILDMDQQDYQSKDENEDIINKEDLKKLQSNDSDDDEWHLDENDEWIESTKEFRQYRAAAKMKHENEKTKFITDIEKKLDGMKQHQENEGIEVEHFFSSTVDHAIIGHSEAEKKKQKAAEILSRATEALKKTKKEFNEVNKKLKWAKEKRDKASKDVELARLNADEWKKNVQVSAEEMAGLKVKVQEYKESVRTAAVAFETAATEAFTSQERAKEAEKRSKRVQASNSSAASRAKYETSKEHEKENAVANEKRLLKEAEREYKASHGKWKKIVDRLEKVKCQVKDIKSASQYHSEQKEFELGHFGEGKMMKKLKIKVDEKKSLEGKLHKATRCKEDTESKKQKAQKSLDEAIKACSDQQKKAAAAREEADNNADLAEQHADMVEEERNAAKMRQDAREKAESHLQKVEAQLAKAEEDLQNAQRVSEEASSNAAKSQANAGKAKRYAMKLEDIKKYVAVVEEKRKELDRAKHTYKKAVKLNDEAQENFEKACNALNNNADLYYKAKIDAKIQESRNDAEESLNHKAVSAYERYKMLANEAEKAKEHANQCQLQAAESAAAYRHAQDYTMRKALILPISMKLSKMTLLHSAKFRYFEKSKALPFNHMHNFAEGKMYEIYEEANNAMSNLIQFNKTHLTRVFPSKHEALRTQTNNYNPVLAWSLGCQIVSMNQQVSDEFVLVNDGRFRVNGSCGYVLKPESMIERKGGDISRRNKAHVNLPRRWSIKILSGYNLPKPRKKALTGTINPRVRVSFYDGGKNIAPIVHVTDTVQTNGLNPVWDEKKGMKILVNDPSTAMVLFSLWDVDEKSNEEDFIAAAAIPISCMRQGYRSIPLFDANHMRCGSHASTMLLTRINAK